MHFFTEKFSQLKEKGKQIKNSIINMSIKPSLKPIAQFIYYTSNQVLLKDMRQRSEQFKTFEIWNFQQKPANYFADCIQNINFFGQPVLPIITMFQLCAKTKTLVDSKITLVLRGIQSVAFISMYLYLCGKYDFFDQALIQCNSLLGIKKDQTQFPTQHSYIKNCMNLVTGMKINTQFLKLKKIVFSHTPILIKPNQEGEIQKFQPRIFIHQGNKRIDCQQYFESKGQIQMKIDCILNDDVMIIVKHSSNLHVMFTCLRLLLNTGFVFENEYVIRAHQMDLSKVIKTDPQFNIKLEIQKMEEKSQLINVWKSTSRLFNKQQHFEKTIISQQQKQKKVQTTQPKKQQQKVVLKVQQKEQQIHEFSEQEVSPEAQIVTKIDKDSDNQSAEDIDDYISKLQQSISQ